MKNNEALEGGRLLADGDGIQADADSSNNRIENNKLLDNAEHDAHDDSVGDLTAGTANKWDDNECVTDNQGGVICDQ